MNSIPQETEMPGSPQSVEFQAREAAEDLRQAAQQKIQALREVTSLRAQHLRQAAKDQLSAMETQVRAHPSKSVLISLGLGMILGIMWHR